MSLEVALAHAFPGFALEVAFEAPPGITALFGRSGSGKTTVVNAVAGLLRPDRGRVAVDGRVLGDTGRGRWLPPHKRRAGYVFQEARLFPHLTVRANLAYGRWFAGATADRAEMARVVEMLGLGTLLDRRPGALSGGERQRVALGRALLAEPRILLMDEPLAALDEARRAEILPYLERLRDATDIPIVYVSHAVAEVARLATTVVALRDGAVVRTGPVGEVLADPETTAATGVRDAGAVLNARLVAHHPDGLSELRVATGRLLLPGVAAAPGALLRVRIQAQEVILARHEPTGLSALNVLPATVVAVRPDEGPGAMVQLALGPDRLLARITRRSAAALDLAPGAECYAIVKSVSVAASDIGGELHTPNAGS